MARMQYVHRQVETEINRVLARGKSLFLFGARQTGKTTLVGRMPTPLAVTLIRPDIRLRYEKDPGALAAEVEALPAAPGGRRPLVLLDEVQKAPLLLDVVQDLVDRDKARFVLTGSSARKLRRGAHSNLLPGRAVVFRLDPFSLREFPPPSLEEALLYGSLPGIVQVQGDEAKEQDLSAYVTTYLEEEVRTEALVRNLGTFARFLELAAAEAGGIVNLRKLASDIGVAHTTIAAYHQILEDCLIVDRIEPLTESATRKKLTRSDKYLFFDLGVRRVAAREGARLLPSRLGQLFEQFVGLELLRWSRLLGRGSRIRFWRDPDGPEVDWVVESEGRYVPIEVKWTDSPQRGDARHLVRFLDEYPSASRGIVVCRAPRRMQLDKKVLAVPWQSLIGEVSDALSEG
jgi:predicted AAA+ superfamily ATPase